MAKVLLKDVRIAFADIFEPTDFNGDGNHKYRLTSLIVPGSANDKAIRAAIDAAGKEKWKEKWPAYKKAMENNVNKFAYQDGAIKPDYDGYEGMWYMGSSNKSRPTVIDRDRTPLTQADGRPYSGCYCNVSIDVYAYSNTGNGISAGLRGIQFVRDGDAFGAGAPAAPDEFEDMSDTGDDEALA